MKRIVIECHGNGTMKIEAIGFKGKACKLATEAIGKALGTVTKTIPKPEFYQANEQSQKAQH